MATVTPVDSILPHIGPAHAANTDLVVRAYDFAKSAHHGQMRHSGEPYLNHLVAVASMLAKIGMGVRTIAAALLHDTLEDTNVSADELRQAFGDEIFFLVEGVTKLGSVRYHGSDRHNESLRKLFVATSQDVRVIIIKLVDRLHNMQTLNFVPPEKQQRIARETLEIYVPIANRLGMGQLRKELEDLTFPYLYPAEYKKVAAIMEQAAPASEAAIETICAALNLRLSEVGFHNFTTTYRTKGIYSLYRKLERHEWDIENVSDYLAIQAVVETVEECYRTLGIIHSLCRPIPKCMKDYIAFPKPNGYRALHTTVLTPAGTIIEVQIRTEAMHKEAALGIITHLYPDELNTTNDTKSWFSTLIPPRFQPQSWQTTQKNTDAYPPTTDTQKVPQWVQEIGNAYKRAESGQEFFDGLKEDFFSHRIFVFTPDGNVVDLPVGASPIDFAYAIHSDIGDSIASVKVNQKNVSLDTELSNGDIVEIITGTQCSPTEQWLMFTKTSTARRHIRSALAAQTTGIKHF